MKQIIKLSLNQIALLAVTIIFVVCTIVAAKSYMKINTEIQQLTVKVEELNQELEVADTQLDDIKDHLKDMNNQLNLIKARLDKIETITDTASNATINSPANATSAANSSSTASMPIESTKINTGESTKVENSALSIVSINATDLSQKSNLSANQFNSIIEKTLESRGYVYTASTFYNIGESLYNMEQTYGINGLFALAVSSQETEYGFSNLAVNKNNLFGISGDNGYRGFDTIDECIQYFGNMIAKYYVGCDRTTISSIGFKYCPGSKSWITNVSWFFNLYGDTCNTLVANL